MRSSLGAGSTSGSHSRSGRSAACCSHASATRLRAPVPVAPAACCSAAPSSSSEPGRWMPAGVRGPARRGRRGEQLLARVASSAAPSGAHADEEDLLQFPDRLKWYEAKFCADTMPDWNAARFLRSRDVAPGTRCLTLEVEISRELVPLRNAYRAPGQKAAIRLKGGFEYHVTVATAPFPQRLNKHPLFLVRGDLFAHEIKTVRDPVSVKAVLEVLVGQREAPELYALQDWASPAQPSQQLLASSNGHSGATADALLGLEHDDEEDAEQQQEDDYGPELELGPFQGQGLDLRSSGILAVYRFPTVVLFVSGRGIATARALLEGEEDAPTLNAWQRKEVRVYYKVPNEAHVLFSERFEAWREGASGPSGSRLHVVPTTARTFQDAFDDDDTFAYDPNYTAAIILTGGDAEAEAEARQLCKEAEITTVLSDSQEAAPVEHLDSTPTSFRKWAQEYGTKQ